MPNYLVGSGNTLYMQNTVTTGIHTCFGRGNDLNTYRGTSWYTAAGGSGTFPNTSSAISYNDFYTKGPDPSYSADYNSASVLTGQNQTHNTNLYINTDGTMTLTTTASFEGGSFPKNWYLPTTAGIGSSYYFRISQVLQWGGAVSIYYNSGATLGSDNTWYSLSTYARLYGAVGSNTAREVNITIDISNDASTVIGTGTISWIQNFFVLP